MSKTEKRGQQNRASKAVKSQQSYYPTLASGKGQGDIPTLELQDLMRRGIQEQQAGRLPEAKAVYQQVLDAEPDHADANHLLGVLAHQTGEAEIAVRLITRAVQKNPIIAGYHGNLGYALHALGRLDDAVASYQEALRIDPNLTQAHMNLGNALAQQGWQDDAIASYRKALGINPDFAQAHSNLGNALNARGQLDDAIASYREALRIDPEYAAAHSNLGSALADQGFLDDAIASYRKALGINPDFAQAHSNLGNALQKLGRFDEAITHFECIGTRIAKARVLECLYAAGRTAAYSEYLSELCRSDPVNIRAAAISAFAAHQWGAENPYPFCKDPLDFIYTANLKSALAPFDGFSARILEEIENAPALWEPTENAVRSGFHTMGNLFLMETPEISVLQNVICERIEDYRSRYADRDNGLIRRWPDVAKLTGWHVKLVKSGHLVPHIHSSGWLSGVIYLKIPDNLEGDEGTIRFSLHGYDYPIRNNDIPSVQHVPKEGDLVLFPSSLFHYTNPFQSDEERHCISFDMYP